MKELDKKKKELSELYLKNETGSLQDYTQISKKKKEIARIMTKLNE